MHKTAGRENYSSWFRKPSSGKISCPLGSQRGAIVQLEDTVKSPLPYRATKGTKMAKSR